MIAWSPDLISSHTGHIVTARSSLSALPVFLTAVYYRRRETGSSMSFSLNTTADPHNSTIPMTYQLDLGNTSTPASTASTTTTTTTTTEPPADLGALAGHVCCCTTVAPTRGILAEMNMPSLIRWFTITGIIFGLVIFFGIINIVIFHRQEIQKKYKRHFRKQGQSQRTSAAQNNLMGDVEGQHGGRGEDSRRFTSLVGQLGYWLRRS